MVEVWRQESYGLECYLGHQMFCVCMPDEDAERLVADFETFFGDGGTLRLLSLTPRHGETMMKESREHHSTP